MSTISKVFTVVNLVLAIFLLGSVAAILAHSSDYKKQYDTEMAAHAETKVDMQGKLDAATGDLSNSQEANRRLTNENNDLKQQNQTLTSEKERMRQDNTDLRSNVSTINTTLTTLQTDLADVQKRNADLTDRNEEYRKAKADAETAKVQAEDDRARFESDLADRDDTVSELQRQIASLAGERDNMRAERQALVAQGINIAELIGNTVPLIEGTVSDVGAGFVVLSVGENDGVQMGFPFDVYRSGNYVGRVIVDKVFPDNSVARVHMKKSGVDFQALDNATTRL